ncbi:MAG: hypothetical protein OSA97_07205, partial [Nevskia sp.]|nr:hypothetical protein [Nevskia sp.]
MKMGTGQDKDHSPMKKPIGLLGSIALAFAALCVLPASADTAANVVCKDGTAGTAGKGACSHHGGVDKKATKAAANAGGAPAAAPSAPAAAPPAPAAPAAAAGDTPAAVLCKDGTTGKAGKGACSHHGGVNKSGSASSAPAAATPAPAAAAPAAAPAP